MSKIQIRRKTIITFDGLFTYTLCCNLRMPRVNTNTKKELFILYRKLPNEEVNMIMQMSELRNLFIEVTSKKNISS